jgi:hypothetical protein
MSKKNIIKENLNKDTDAV